MHALDNVGGGLVLGPKQASCVLSVPREFEAPRRLDNSAYLTPLEYQGVNPWCGPYSLCQALQASFWRRHGWRCEFDEAVGYPACKAIDNVRGDGTTLEALVAVANTVDLSHGRAPLPRVSGKWIADPGDVVFGIHRYGLVMMGLRITAGWKRTDPNGRIGPDSQTLGGHAVLASGYDLEADEIWGPNWWGVTWGVNGFWRMSRAQFAQQYWMGFGLEIAWPEVRK